MNYVILNDEIRYKDNITLNGFKEVSINGKERVDGVFGTITEELLETELSDPKGRNQFSRESWICRDSGVRFVVIKIPQNILYTESEEHIKKCFGLFNQERFYVEIWSIKLKDKEKYEYYLIGFNKDFDFDILLNEEFVEKKETEIIDFICQKIEKKLFI